MSGEPIDYHAILDIGPAGARADARFYTLLTEWLPYRAHPGGEADLRAWADARAELPDGPATSFLAWLTHAAPAFLDVMPAHPHHALTMTPAQLDERQQAFDPVLAALLIETRQQGATVVPACWGDDNVSATWRSRGLTHDPREWTIQCAGGVACYTGQSSPVFEALRACTRDLCAGDDGSTPGGAFHLWDVTGMLVGQQDWGGVVDALSLAEELPPLHPRGLRMLASYGLVAHASAGVRLAAARFLQRHPHPDAAGDLVETLLAEHAGTVAAPQVVALRVIGGEIGFDALLRVATRAVRDETRRLAARALAHLDPVTLPDRDRRVTKLLLDRDADRRAAGAVALSESKHGSRLDRGGELATADEMRSGVG